MRALTLLLLGITLAKAGEPELTTTRQGLLRGALTESFDTGLTSEPKPLVSSPGRPAPLLELGDPFLERGPLLEVVPAPGGAGLQPTGLVWGSARTALQATSTDAGELLEWANQLSLHGQLGLSQTERLVVSVRALDEGGRFSGYHWERPGLSGSGWDNALNFRLRALFIEGFLNELLPDLDPDSRHGLDIGFALGRQRLRLHEGLFVDDSVDALGLSKLNLKMGPVANWSTALMLILNELNLGGLEEDQTQAWALGSFNEFDLARTTIRGDVAWLDAPEGDGLYWGLSATQRIHGYSTVFRLLGSQPSGQRSEHNRAGLLLTGTVSWQPVGHTGNAYVNGWLGIDHYRSLSREAGAPALLSPLGLLYASPGLGRFPAPIRQGHDEAAGLTFGYQCFRDDQKQQMVVEAGARFSTQSRRERSLGLASRLQMALSQRDLVRLDGFAVHEQEEPAGTEREDVRLGGRVEWLHRF